MAELTSSTREAARRLGVSDTTMHKAERTGRIAREADGQWDIAKTRARLQETADPQRSTLSGSAAAEGTPFARLKVAQLALKVEAQRLALDESKGRLLDVATANATIDEIASTMRDALLNWPARGRRDCRRTRRRAPFAANHPAAAHQRASDGGFRTLRPSRHRRRARAKKD